jgi:hypothetical protein
VAIKPEKTKNAGGKKGRKTGKKRGKKNWGDRRKKEDPNRQTQGQPREHREEEIIKKQEQRDYRDQSFSFFLSLRTEAERRNETEVTLITIVFGNQ